MTLKHRWTRIALAIAVALTAVPAVAQQAAPPPAVDPDAVAALNRMATYLRTLKTFQVEAATTRDSVSDDGQLVTRGTTVNYVVQMPNKVLADVFSDRSERQFVLRRQDLHDAGAPSRLLRHDSGAADGARTRRRARGEVRHRAAAVGPLPLGHPELDSRRHHRGDGHRARRRSRGTTCEQYAFRQDGVDWQIWIQNGDYPLPRKLVITTTTDEARPAVFGHLHLEPRAVGERRGLRVHAAQGRRQEYRLPKSASRGRPT